MPSYTNDPVVSTAEVTAISGISKTGEGIHGESQNENCAAVAGINSSGVGVYGESRGNGAGVVGVSNGEGAGLYAECRGKGPGVFSKSQNWEGLHGETQSNVASAVAGIQLNPNGTGAGVYAESNGAGAGLYADSQGKGPGVFSKSQNWEGLHGETQSDVASAIAAYQLNPNGTGPGLYAESHGKGAGVIGFSKIGEGVHGDSQNENCAAVAGINSSGTGVYGESRGKGAGVVGVSSGGVGVYGKGGRLAGHFDGDVEVTGDIRLLHADCAEDFTVGAQVLAAPGTVMVLGEEGALFPCLQAYDKRVAGVVSGAGNYKPGIVLDKQDSLENRSPIALIGKVYCKVDANLGAIEIGDLLTTSPTLGHAMKAADPLKAFGAIIGKALRPLQEGQGLIPILVALQ